MVILANVNLRKIDADQLWVAFGVGNHLKYLPLHTTARDKMSQEQFEDVPFSMQLLVVTIFRTSLEKEKNGIPSIESLPTSRSHLSLSISFITQRNHI